MPERFNVCLLFPGSVPSGRALALDSVPGILGVSELRAARHVMYQDVTAGVSDDEPWAHAVPNRLTATLSESELVTTYFELSTTRRVSVTIESDGTREVWTASLPVPFVLSGRAEPTARLVSRFHRWGTSQHPQCRALAGPEFELPLDPGRDDSHIIERGLTSDLLGHAIVRTSDEKLVPSSLATEHLKDGWLFVTGPKAG